MLELLKECRGKIQARASEVLFRLDKDFYAAIFQVVEEQFDILIKEANSIDLEQQVRNSY